MHKLSRLEKNVKNIWGEKGQHWLDDLPHLIETLSLKWQLSDLTPVKNMSYNFVAFALREKNTPVVLKISCDEKQFLDEAHTLRHFNRIGSVSLLASDEEYFAMLLERAIPGTALKFIPSFTEQVKAYAPVVRKISSLGKANASFTHMSQWCEAIDRMNSKLFQREWVAKAKAIKNHLLNSTVSEYVCHGDLHLENIVKQGDSWLSIDPKGIIGEMAFEVAAFDLVNDDELKRDDLNKIILARVEYICTQLPISEARLLSWIFLRVMISAQWFIEDKGSPDKMLKLAEILYVFVKA